MASPIPEDEAMDLVIALAFRRRPLPRQESPPSCVKELKSSRFKQLNSEMHKSILRPHADYYLPDELILRNLDYFALSSRICISNNTDPNIEIASINTLLRT
jgi:hypothetical protein